MDNRQLNILLADDDEQDYLITRDLLAAIPGWQIKLEWVSTYEAALAKMKQGQPDLCLLNYRLSEYSGQALLDQTTKNGLATPLILLAEPEDHPMALAALETNAVDYLIKGQIDVALLERSIRYAVKSRQIEETVERRVQEHTTHLAAMTEQLQQELATYQQRAEALQASEQQYRLLFDIDIYGLEVLDEEGNIVDCNATYQRLLGYSREQLIGQPSPAFMSDKSKAAFKRKWPLLKERGYIEGEMELVRRDGSAFLVWNRSRVIYDKNGAFAGVVAYNRDISERMKAVKQISTLARALEQSPVAIMIADQAGNIEYVNFEFTELTGYTYDEAVGQNLHGFKLDQQSPEDYAELWQVITAGNEWRGELQSLKKEGEAYMESLIITPMFNAKGVLTHFIIVQEDVTTRRQAELEAIQSQRRIGNLMTEHISDLTTANEALQREIAQRERAEKALQRSRARLKAQYKGTPIPTYSWQRVNEDFVLIDYNDAAEKASHGRIAGFMGKTAREMFKDRPQVLADFARCFEEKKTIKREAPYRLLTTGETRYFVTTYNFVSPNLIIDHIEDITESKQTETDLTQCRAQLEALTSVQATELAKVKETWQHEFSQREQAWREEEGRLLAAHAAELAKANETWQREVARREQALQEAEERLKQITSNIDDRLKEQYRSIPIPTYSWQMIAGEFVLVDFNDAAEKARGRMIDLMGKTASEIFEERPEVLADFSRCYAEKTTIKREAPYQLLATGETRYFVTTYHFTPPNLVIVHIEDITQHKQVAVELEQSQVQLQELAAGHAAELAKAHAALQQEVAEHQRLAQALAQAEAELKKFQGQFEDLVKERTAELTKTNQHLQRELFKHERAEESLREARVRLKAQYKGIPLSTYSWQRVGKDFVLVDYNDAAEKASQGRIADFMGKTAHEVFKDRPQVLADFARCFEEKGAVRREAPYRLLTTGETRHFVTTYNFVPPNLIIVYIDDVTDYKRTERSLHVSEELVELVCRFWPDTTLTFVNDAYCWYLGLERAELIGRVMPFVFDEDREKISQHFASLSQENPVGAIEYRIIKPDGSLRWQQWINRAILDKQGRLIEVQSVGRDITHRKKVE